MDGGRLLLGVLVTTADCNKRYITIIPPSIVQRDRLAHQRATLAVLLCGLNWFCTAGHVTARGTWPQLASRLLAKYDESNSYNTYQ
jgi:hypothetical protein